MTGGSDAFSEEELPAKPASTVPRWIVRGFVVMSVYLLIVGVGAGYAIVSQRELSNQNRELIDKQHADAEIAEARVCTALHTAHNETEVAINIVPTALLEVAGDPPEDPARVEVFLESIRRQIRDTITDPTCDREAARRTLERHGVGE